MSEIDKKIAHLDWFIQRYGDAIEVDALEAVLDQLKACREEVKRERGAYNCGIPYAELRDGEDLMRGD